ncbi:ABC transporter substrate-binding protein [Natronorubrum sp. DTA7]|uniref:ABC transporter substrate-binding protein n=1 Tax=Natronorubrum sp. DTA7 TaxID=3447016 RepID=UPI003F87CB18
MPQTRRQYLASAGATTAALGLSGCLSSFEGDDREDLTLAYVPIYPNMQHFVMEDAGYYNEIPIEVTIERFNSGPAVVQAFASDEVDAAIFGITPSMVLVDQGKDASVLAANSQNGFKIVGTTQLASLYDEHGGDAFVQFEDETGRQPQIGAPPDGSVPDVVLRFWIEERLGFDELLGPIRKSQLPPARVPQAIESGELDGAIIQEPFATIITETDGFEALAWSGEIMTDHPVTVLFVHDRVTDGESAVARALVEQHARATELANNQPDVAAEHAASVIGDGVDVTLAREAIESAASDFISDPTVIADQSDQMAEYVASLGNTDEVVGADRLINRTVYENVVE